MIYKDYKRDRLSALGLGCMRLPTVNGVYADIDKEAVKEMVAYAMEHGINYYDTAWGYHEGNSELVMGEILSEYPRESYRLASKFPGYDLSNMDKVEQIFERQLVKCRTEYFDFYLFHNLCEMNINEYLDPKYGIFDYLMKQRVNGRIKHLGVSVHSSYETLKRFLESYGQFMEFCQIQLNWFDYKFQRADKKLELLKQYNIPVWVMEPVRGGKLMNLAEEDLAKLKEMRPDETAAGVAFRFLQSIPEVTMILSGMSNMQQLKENIETFSTEKPLDEAERGEIMKIAHKMAGKGTVPCTACRYCTEHCPMELDIPRLIELYNEHKYSGGGFIAPMALSAMPDDKKPSACIACQSCEAVCPQQIKIHEVMAEFGSMIQTF